MTESARGPLRPPYAPVKGVREFFEKVIAKAAPARINREYLASIGVAANNEQHLVATLRFLRLIDEEGCPTRQFEVLYYKGADRKRGLQNLVRQAYPSLFAREIELNSAGRAEIHDHFVRHFGVRGQLTRKAMALFLFLCAFAGIPVSPDLAHEGRVAAGERSGATVRSGSAGGAVVRRGVARSMVPSAGAGQRPTAGGDWPFVLTLGSEMSEDEIVAFLRRVKRAIARVDSEEEA